MAKHGNISNPRNSSSGSKKTYSSGVAKSHSSRTATISAQVTINKDPRPFQAGTKSK